MVGEYNNGCICEGGCGQDAEWRVNKLTTASRFHYIFPFLSFFQVGEVEGQPGKSGVFPVSFVRVLTD